MTKSDKPFVFRVAEKKPRQINRLAIGAAIGMLVGIILSYTTGVKDYSVVLGTAIGAVVGLIWDWLAVGRNKKNKPE